MVRTTTTTETSVTVYKRRCDLQQEAPRERAVGYGASRVPSGSAQRKNIQDPEETRAAGEARIPYTGRGVGENKRSVSFDKPTPRSEPPRYASAVGTRVSPISLASSPVKPPCAPVEVAQLLRPGARLNAINGLRAPTSDVRLEIHVKTPNSSEGRARMDMWKAEGWGDDPDDEGRDFDSEDYVTKADYPFGLSFSYTGNRHGVRGFPKITLASAYRMLLLNGTECAHLIKYLKGDIKSRLMASGIRNKLSEPESEDEASSSKKKPTKSRAEKERIRKANDEAVEQWDNLIVNPLKEFKYLPPPIRDEFRYSPESVKYGKHGVIYTQASRCYTHCLDRIALEVASKLRSEEKLAGQDYDRVFKLRKDWRV